MYKFLGKMFVKGKLLETDFVVLDLDEQKTSKEDAVNFLKSMLDFDLKDSFDNVEIKYVTSEDKLNIFLSNGVIFKYELRTNDVLLGELVLSDDIVIKTNNPDAVLFDGTVEDLLKDFKNNKYEGIEKKIVDSVYKEKNGKTIIVVR